MRELSKKYKTTSTDNLKEINYKIKEVMSKLDLLDRTEPIKPQVPKITIKDHKKDFPDSVGVRLICPTKSDIGRLSKTILDKQTVRKLRVDGREPASLGKLK
ncbi:Hypothetical predicted protein [Octopus vulgaris]|uniref:Uncharacterized protein n=1 Tax=Octopus vulgaris TaxID=6645 RepID=A0AA36BA41_OCTVU|nr:Hypothetical predicted protein [Octopus vulgaris]